MKFGKSTAGFSQSCFDVFLGTIVFTGEITKVNKVLYNFKWFTIKHNRCGWCGTDTHHLCLDFTDGKPSLLCIAV